MTTHNFEPVADDAAEIQKAVGKERELDNQENPAFVDVNSPVLCTAAIKLLPSVEHATNTFAVFAHGIELELHERPESNEV